MPNEPGSLDGQPQKRKKLATVSAEEESQHLSSLSQGADFQEPPSTSCKRACKNTDVLISPVCNAFLDAKSKRHGQNGSGIVVSGGRKSVLGPKANGLCPKTIEILTKLRIESEFSCCYAQKLQQNWGLEGIKSGTEDNFIFNRVLAAHLASLYVILLVLLFVPFRDPYLDHCL